MAAKESAELVPDEAIAMLVEDARRHLAGMVRTGSRYRDLAQVARIHQEIGNACSALVYETMAKQGEGIACARGCDSCCLIPSEARGIDTGNFTMSVLDSITLVERYDEIKQADNTLPARAQWAAEQARRTRDLVRCPHLSAAGECGIYVHRPVACKIWFSAELAPCIKNRQDGYRNGVNTWTDASGQLRGRLMVPFIEAVREIAPDIKFAEYDFLLCFEYIAKLDARALFATLQAKIDAGEQNTWNPFD